MPDFADDACIHPLATLEHSHNHSRTEWLCCDCGKVFASLADEAGTVSERALELWAAKAQIPNARVIRYVRGLRAEPGTLRVVA